MNEVTALEIRVARLERRVEDLESGRQRRIQALGPREAIRRFLEMNGECSLAEIVAELDGVCTPVRVRVTLGRMVADGSIQRCRWGRYGPLAPPHI